MTVQENKLIVPEKLALKVAVINFSGNVGKSTVAKNVFQPRLQDGVENYYTVETINADDNSDEAERLRGKQFGELQEELLVLDSAIVDIGASNVEDVMKLMSQYRGSHDDYDLFVVPVTNSKKEMQDSIATIEALSVLGVPANKIKVIFNKVEVDDVIEDVFYPMMAFQKDTKMCSPMPKIGIRFSELYQTMKDYDADIATLMSHDQKHYKTNLATALKALKEAESKKDKAAIEKAQLAVDNGKVFVSMRRLAEDALENLNNVFNQVVKK